MNPVWKIRASQSRPKRNPPSLTKTIKLYEDPGSLKTVSRLQEELNAKKEELRRVRGSLEEKRRLSCRLLYE